MRHLCLWPRVLLSSIAVLVIAVSAASGSCQSTPPPGGPPPLPKDKKFPAASGLPAVQQEQFLSYWTSETGWHSDLQLRNNSLQDLAVTPVLRRSDGTEVPLSPITIKSEEVVSVNLDDAISASNAPNLVGTYGSAVLRYTSPTQASLYAAIMVSEPGHPIMFHIDENGDAESFQSGSREGIWWLPNNTATGYLIETNFGSQTIPLVLSLYDPAGREYRQVVALPAQETVRLSIRDLVRAAGFTSSYGGIKVAAAAHAGSLDTVQFLFDENAGFSALMKMFDYDPQVQIGARDYARTGSWTLRAPMLALSTPDPALAFPAGTQLQPLLMFRNTTAKTISAALRFTWRSATTTGKTAGLTLQLAPFQTQQVDVAALQKAGTIPLDANWALVTLTTNSLPDEVVAVAASYDSSLRYGAQTPFSDQLTFRWEGGMWQYDAFHDSLIAAGNGGTQPISARFTIFYNQGTQRYDLEQSLQPDEEMWIDVGQLIRQQTPDKNGSTLPLNLTTGSYEIADLSHKGAGTVFEGKVIYDKTYGHVAYGCAACCGYGYSATFWYDPLGILDGSWTYQGVQAPDECQGGAAADVSDSFYGNWSVQNTGIATVDYYGTHTAVSVGSTSSNTSGRINNNDARLGCPLVPKTPSGNDNIYSLTCTSVTRGQTTTCTVNGPSGATYSGWQFHDSGGHTVNSSNSSSSWSGVAVQAGTVSVTVTGSGENHNQTTVTAAITVNSRNWHTNPATATEVPNNTFWALPVPPQPSGDDSGLGISRYAGTDNGAPGTTISDGGPNNGYYYYTSFTFSQWLFQYEINPDLENSGSTFSQHQCGNYNGSTGYISWSNLITQTKRHEYNSATQSHYAFYKNALSSNNLGDYIEARVAPPGTNLSSFDQTTRSTLNSDYTAITTGMEVEPYPVNDSEVGAFLGNINYTPYANCN
jgi:hypothetical protein